MYLKFPPKSLLKEFNNNPFLYIVKLLGSEPQVEHDIEKKRYLIESVVKTLVIFI